MRATLIGTALCVAVWFSSTPVHAVTVAATGAFEFNAAPSTEGAGWAVQPLNNVRTGGEMAYPLGTPITVPLDPTPVSTTGRAINNGDGTFRYGMDSEGGASMAFVQAKDPGDGLAPFFPSPFVNADAAGKPTKAGRDFTLEGRFKVTGEADDASPDPHKYFGFAVNAFGSNQFAAYYGRQGPNLNDTSAAILTAPGPINFYGYSDMGDPPGSTWPAVPRVFDQWVKLRVVSTGLSTTGGRIETFVQIEGGDQAGWYTGPLFQGITNATMDRPALIYAATDGLSFGNVDVDYVRWTNQRLTTQDSLGPVPEPASLGLLGFGIALLMARRRRS